MISVKDHHLPKFVIVIIVVVRWFLFRLLEEGRRITKIQK